MIIPFEVLAPFRKSEKYLARARESSSYVANVPGKEGRNVIAFFGSGGEIMYCHVCFVVKENLRPRICSDADWPRSFVASPTPRPSSITMIIIIVCDASTTPALSPRNNNKFAPKRLTLFTMASLFRGLVRCFALSNAVWLNDQVIIVPVSLDVLQQLDFSFAMMRCVGSARRAT